MVLRRKVTNFLNDKIQPPLLASRYYRLYFLVRLYQYLSWDFHFVMQISDYLQR